LAGAGWRVVRDLASASRPAGGSLVGDMTSTLDRWDDWLDDHPEQTREFVERTVHSAGEMASAAGHVFGFLNRLATVAQPVLDRAVQLGGVVAQLGPIATGAGGALLLGFTRALRSGEATVAAGGLGPGMAFVGGASRSDVLAGTAMRGGSMAWSARKARTAESASARAFNRLYGGVDGARYGAPVRLGTTAAEASGAARIGMAARAGGKAFWPVALLFGALDFASYNGNVGDRTMAALSSATLGIVERPKTDAGLVDEEIARSTDRLRGPQRTAILGDTDVFGVNVGGLGSGEASGTTDDERRQLRARIEALHAERKALADLGDELHRSRDLRVAERLGKESRTRARAWAADMPTIYSVLTGGGEAPAEAAGELVDRTRARLGNTRDAGVETLSEAALSWARTLDADAPGVTEVVEELRRDVRERFAAMGKDVRFVGASVLTGSRKEWQGIAAALRGPVETAREKLSDDFTAVQRQAVGSLEAMGYGAGQARSIVAQIEKGGQQGRLAALDARQGPTGAGMRPSVNARNQMAGRATGGPIEHAVMEPMRATRHPRLGSGGPQIPRVAPHVRRPGRLPSPAARVASWPLLARSAPASTAPAWPLIAGTAPEPARSMTGPGVWSMPPAPSAGTIAAARAPRGRPVELPGVPRPRPKAAPAPVAPVLMRPPRLSVDPDVLPAPVLGLLRRAAPEQQQEAPSAPALRAGRGSVGRIAVTVEFEDAAERQRRVNARVAQIAAERLLAAVRHGSTGIIE
jgi:hypothetical protein